MSTTDDSSLNVIAALRFVRRRWIWLVGFMLMGAAAFFIRASLEEPVYEATSTLLFRPDTLSSTLAGSAATSDQSSFSDLPGAAMQTNLRLIEVRPVAEAVARKLGTNESPDDLLRAVSVQQDGLTSLAKITASRRSPAAAARLATTWAQVFEAVQGRSNERRIQGGIVQVRRRLSAGGLDTSRAEVLRRRLDQLETLATVTTPTATVEAPAVPPQHASSPRKRSALVIGALLGLLLGTAAAFVREALDRRVKEPDELAIALDLPLLVVVPETDALAAHPSANGSAPDARAIEPFRMLRANLRYFNVDRAVRSVLVTSAEAGDGKSTTAWNLAIAEASSGTRTVLLEADLRKPSLARDHGLSATVGLSAVLSREIGWRDALLTFPLKWSSNGSNVNSGRGNELDILPAGVLPPNPSSLIESGQMRTLLAELADAYDLVIIDSPPVSVVSDAIPLVSQVDGVIVVGRVGKSSRDSVRRLRDQLAKLGAKPFGVVANGAAATGESYYAYGYSEQRSPA